MTILDLAQRGAEITAQLKLGETAELRADLNRIAAEIEQGWERGDIESIESAQSHVRGLHVGDFQGYVRVWLKGTSRTCAIDGRGWAHRLIHYLYETENKK